MGSMPNIFGNVSPYMANPQVASSLVGSQPLNPEYYATKQATDALAKYFGGTSGTYAGPSGGTGISNPNTEYGVNIGGRMYNAGNLAADLQKWGPDQLKWHGYDPGILAGINPQGYTGPGISVPGPAGAGPQMTAAQMIMAGRAGDPNNVAGAATPNMVRPGTAAGMPPATMGPTAPTGSAAGQPMQPGTYAQQAVLAAGVPQATQPNASGPSFTPTGGPSFNNSSQFFAPALPNTPASQAGGGQAGSNTGVNSIDQWMANFLGQGGQPTDQTQAWHSMIDAQQRGIKENFANLNEAFNVSGNRFSSSYGNAATDFWSQTSKDQNSLLAQMTLASQEAARQRQMGLASQLSSQAFQGTELGQQQAFAGASQASSQAAQMAQMLAQMSAQGGSAMFGAENQAANSLFNNAQSLLPFLSNLNQQGAGNLSQLYNQSLQTGGQLGGQQYGTLQDQINRMYQQFYATQPQTNPLLQYLMSGATTNPQLMYPSIPQSQLGSTLGGIGGILGGLGGLLGFLFPGFNSNP